MAEEISLISVLLPGTTDIGLDGLALSTFIDGEVSVPVSAVDQLLVAFNRHLIDRMPRSVAVIQLPRAHHRIALTLAICMHLLRLQEPLVAGPVVLAALDVDLTGQFRRLRMRNHRSIALDQDNPLSAQRLTRAGELAPLIGAEVRSGDSSLVYFNTRVGNPVLPQGNPPLVVIDATSITNPESRARLLAWASSHSAVSTVVVGDIGDESLIKAVTATGSVPLVLPVTDVEVSALIYELNRQKPAPSPLSSMWMLWHEQPPPLSIYRAGDTEINAAIARAFACLAARPDGLMPRELDYPVRLLNSGTRLAAAVHDYRRACALADRPGEGPGGLLRVLEGLRFTGLGPWHAWGVARWGELKVAVETLWRHLDEANPKLGLLWELLARADRGGGPILIRCHSKAAAVATTRSLSGENRTDAQVALWARISTRIELGTFTKRYPPGYADIQILTGSPPPRHFSLLFSGEARATWLLAYEAEDAALRRQLRRWHDTTDAWRHTTFQAIGAPEPASVAGPLSAVEIRSALPEPSELRLPHLSILDVLDSAIDAMDSPSIVDVSAVGWHSSAATDSCVPVQLDDGRTWWVRNEKDRDGDLATPVLVVTVSNDRRYLPLRELQPGDAIVVPAGDGTDSVHARLVALSHTNDDVASLDAILGQFRRAARVVLEAHSTRQAAIAAVRDAGAQAPGELTRWASGRTIAPRVPEDIVAVFRAARQTSPDLMLLHRVAGRLRTLHRALGYVVTALASGRVEDAVKPLRRLVGDVADEVLDEFVAAIVIRVGQPATVSADLAGRIG